MQSEYAAVLEGATVEEAVEIVRSLAEAVRDIHNVFVVDHRFHLLGVLPLRGSFWRAQARRWTR